MEGFTLPYLWKLLYYEKTPYFEHTHTFQNYFIYFLVLHPANKTGFEWLGGGDRPWRLEVLVEKLVWNFPKDINSSMIKFNWSLFALLIEKIN